MKNKCLHNNYTTELGIPCSHCAAEEIASMVDKKTAFTEEELDIMEAFIFGNPDREAFTNYQYSILQEKINRQRKGLCKK